MDKLESTPSVSFLGKRLYPAASAMDLGVPGPQPYLQQPELYLHVFEFSKLCQINRVRSSFDAKTLEMLIKSLVFSKMLYCSTVWANMSSSNIKNSS